MSDPTNPAWVIWKYPLGLERKIEIEAPQGAEWLDVQVQQGRLAAWALVCPSRKAVKHTLYLFGTGWEIPGDLAEDLIHIATVQEGTYVWHIFEDIVPAR